MNKFENPEVDFYSNITPNMYVKDYMNIDKFISIIISGQSNCGKSNFVVNLLRFKLIHEFDLENIWFFSKTIKTDLTYRPIFKYFAENKIKPKIYDTVDFKMINQIVKTQEEVGI